MNKNISILVTVLILGCITYAHSAAQAPKFETAEIKKKKIKQYSGFGLHGEDLSKFWPLTELGSENKSYRAVRDMTVKLGIPAIKIYDIPLASSYPAFSIKEAAGTMPVFKEDPRFEGILVNSKWIDDHYDDDTTYGLLAHEVAHMLLPADIMAWHNDTQKKDIQEKNARVQKVLKNLHDAISGDKIDKYGLIPEFADEAVADYVSGGILAYLNLELKPYENMLMLLWLEKGQSTENETHRLAKKRIEYVRNGYNARSVD